MKTRRNFLKAAALGAAAVALPSLTRAAEGRRPNFLFILTDDQRWDIMSCVQKEQGARARFPWLKTPNLDRLAAEGVRFRNAFVVNSLCAPSRASFLSGCYGHVNGIVNNHTPFPLDNVTHASVLRSAGYTTGYVGKWHMGSQVERPGFDFAASFVGQGIYFNCPIVVNGQTKPSTGWVDDVGTDYAIDFLTQYKHKPFALCVGFKATHGPFTPPPRRENDYANETARPVPNLGAPAIYHGGAKRAAADGAVKTNLGYFRCIAAMDDNVGRLLKALDELGLAQNTVVVFAGDNGYYLGEHQLGDKRSAYEESLRIPLLVRWPRRVRGGRTDDRMVLNIDLAPTFLDLAELAVPPVMQGKSWKPLLEETPNADWRKAYFYAYFAEKKFGAPFVTAVRTETAKLIRYPGHDEWTELFDLATDSYELKNLWNQPDAAELRQKMEAEYERQKAAIGFRVPEFADKPEEQAAGPQPLAAWVLDYRFDKDQGAQVTDASGQKNHGTAKGATLVEGREGRKARRFDGQGWIEVGKPASLNPGVGAWTVEATFRADKPDGVVLAHGGQTMGYMLALEGGKPVFVVNAAHKNSRVISKREVTGQWVRVTAQWNGKNMTLAVDGQPVGKAKLRDAPDRLPNDGLQIGADQGSQLLEKPLPKFTGLMERLRIYSGEAPEAKP
jgi:arylsulfatase A-like enzyme